LTQESQVPAVMACTAWLTALALARFDTTVIWPWCLASGARIGGRSKSLPAFFGVNRLITAPCGK
jgi:hypothetical protein